MTDFYTIETPPSSSTSKDSTDESLSSFQSKNKFDNIVSLSIRTIFITAYYYIFLFLCSLSNNLQLLASYLVVRNKLDSYQVH